MKIPFNKPYTTGKELEYIQQAFANLQFSGDGPFTKKCHDWFEENLPSDKALLTHSCTAALEMAAILADIQPGDEVIMPSYTFVSTANAFVLRGGVPVFVDIRSDTLNIDETKIEAAITSKTKAIVPVHYAGVPCEMDAIMEIAKKYNLLVIEDAAQGMGSYYNGKHLGTLGHLGAFSFHETKNIISGEGGALIINDKRFLDRSEVVREKGTNRKKFIQGQVDKYSWVDIGSSYLPGELISAFLLAQLENIQLINSKRLDIWNKYHTHLEELQVKGFLKRPVIPDGLEHNAHMYYVILETEEIRNDLLNFLNQQNIVSVFHYIPLHSSKMGVNVCRTSGSLSMTENLSNRLLRLPMFADLTFDSVEFVCSKIKSYFNLR